MSDLIEPPPLFDEEDSRKDEEDIFASAVQSPISGDVEADPSKSASLHPLIHEDEEDYEKAQKENESSCKPQMESGDQSSSSVPPDFEPHALDSLNLNNDNAALINVANNTDQVRDSLETECATDGNHGGGLTSLNLDITSLSPASEPFFDCDPNSDFNEEHNSPIHNNVPKPHFLTDTDTTEVILDSCVQEISLSDDDEDLFKSVGPTLHASQDNSLKTTGIASPIEQSMTQPHISSFSTSYSTATSISPTPISPVTTPPTQSATRPTSFEQMNDGDTFIEIIVSDPQKIGDGMGSYMAYKVTTKTNVQYFRKKHWSVTRRFSDFLGLHSKLVEKHLHSGVIIPPAPEKAAIATTKIKLGSDKNSDSSSVEFIERRRAALERYMNRTAAHPKLRSDPDFREFIELDTDLPKATSTSAISSAGVLRLFNKVGETVNKMTFKMDESDQWFEEKTQQIENLDNQLRKLHASLEGLVSYRRELANSTGNFSKSAAVLSSVEEHTALSRALHQLSEAMDRVHFIHHAQADADFFHLSETTKDYVNIIGAVKEVFHERVKSFQTWQHSQATLGKKRENKAKMELSGRIDKVEQANEEVKEWESKVERSQEEFERISKAIKAEMEQFDVIRVIDFKDMLIKYLEALITSQVQVVKVWESFLPEAKAIA